jgi:hypothetical protein
VALPAYTLLSTKYTPPNIDWNPPATKLPVYSVPYAWPALQFRFPLSVLCAPLPGPCFLGAPSSSASYTVLHLFVSLSCLFVSILFVVDTNPQMNADPRAWQRGRETVMASFGRHGKGRSSATERYTRQTKARAASTIEKKSRLGLGEKGITRKKQVGAKQRGNKIKRKERGASSKGGDPEALLILSRKEWRRCMEAGRKKNQMIRNR